MKLFANCLNKTPKRQFSVNIKALFEDSKSLQESNMSENQVTRKPRYDGRTKKRQWEDRRSDKGAGLDPTMPKLQKTSTTCPENINTEKIKRRKFALLLGYSGTEYFGMQRNPNTKTIEEDLLHALFKTNFITEDCYQQVQNMQYQRAARTDKGVSAARQVVSLKLGENFQVEKVNAELPEVIRVFGSRRVTKGFNSKSQCDGRTYIYVLPTAAFAKQGEEVSQKEFRLSEETRKKINDVLALYVGTKNFHNFTSKKKPNDPSVKRYIKSFICEEPFIKDDTEFCVLKVFGQSFMLHQIRKMVGLVIAIVKGIAEPEIINTALKMEKLAIPRAPGLGLVLDYVHYERYNHRYGSDGCHDNLTWEKEDPLVEEFKKQHIFPIILNTEINDQSMLGWIENKLSRHNYSDTENDEYNKSEDEAEDDDADDDDLVERKSNNITKIELKKEENILNNEDEAGKTTQVEKNSNDKIISEGKKEENILNNVDEPIDAKENEKNKEKSNVKNENSNKEEPAVVATTN